MALRVRFAALSKLNAALSATAAALAAIVAAPLSAAPPDAAGVLVDYAFDEEIPTGPDTIRVFEHARGSVALTSTFRYGGYRALELRDIAASGDFPELIAYFPQADEGHLFVQLALLVATPDEEWNIGLAGPGGFGLEEDGLAFWLTGRDGWLFHTSDSIPKRLHALEALTWYVLTVDYDVGRGRYDLWLHREGDESPLLTLRDQPNAASRPGSAVSMLSFISDAGRDLSNAVYYVDDVLVARDRPASLGPMVAPGRRRFFVDRQSPSLEDFLRSCPAAFGLEELGLGGARLAGLDEEEVASLAELVAASRARAGAEREDPSGARDRESEAPDAAVNIALEVMANYRLGCSALERGRYEAAALAFAAGVGAVAQGSGGEVPTALLLGWGHALVALERWEELDRVLARLEPIAHDVRYALLAAFALARTGDPAEALAWVEPRARGVVEEAAGGVADASSPLLVQETAAAPSQISSGQSLRAAEAYIALLRVGDRLAEAREFAEGIATQLTSSNEMSSRFHELAGQIAFAQRDLGAARVAFERAREGAEYPSRLLLALADVAWLQGDREEERRLREGIYGRLRVEGP